ncbi:hypothetical protein PN441_03705 [Spirulina major CS-329]|uniref:hypothetical protein n=1 Tax=Spirulina TaxID=1154 RepID=UPI00232FC3D5|nr:MULTISPECIES: hypothetical protein [Spirulina]MDB9493352.1 hypothetical protein [Spirulina subsalsa CS-330]MDB9502164.1 hypothetical protein [Spirulina major CS-329]
MANIREIVQDACCQGYLCVEAENELRRLLLTCNADDVVLFTQLQLAIMDGRVTQEAREQFYRRQTQATVAV